MSAEQINIDQTNEVINTITDSEAKEIADYFSDENNNEKFKEAIAGVQMTPEKIAPLFTSITDALKDENLDDPQKKALVNARAYLQDFGAGVYETESNSENTKESVGDVSFLPVLDNGISVSFTERIDEDYHLAEISLPGADGGESVKHYVSVPKQFVEDESYHMEFKNVQGEKTGWVLKIQPISDDTDGGFYSFVVANKTVEESDLAVKPEEVEEGEPEEEEEEIEQEIEQEEPVIEQENPTEETSDEEAQQDDNDIPSDIEETEKFDQRDMFNVVEQVLGEFNGVIKPGVNVLEGITYGDQEFSENLTGLTYGDDYKTITLETRDGQKTVFGVKAEVAGQEITTKAIRIKSNGTIKQNLSPVVEVDGTILFMSQTAKFSLNDFIYGQENSDGERVGGLSSVYANKGEDTLIMEQNVNGRTITTTFTKKN